MSSHTLSQTSKPIADVSKPGCFWDDLLYCFRSVHLAIILLSLLAVGTLIGVVMPQVGTADVADIQQQFGLQYKFFNTLGFFNVFSSFWFISLQVLFFFNLLIGSFKWLKPATLAAVQKIFYSPDDMMLPMPEVHSLTALSNDSPQVLEAKLSKTLKQQFRYQVYRDGQGNLYAAKGSITRLGPSIAHVGILLCLIAGLFSCFTGFKALNMAVPGDIFNIQSSNSFKTNVPRSIWLGSIPHWKIRVVDFHVQFYKDRPDVAEQYYSKLQVVSPDNKVLKEDTIFVNHPLSYDNITIYQASYAPTGRFSLTINGHPTMVSANSQFNQRSVSLTNLKDGNTLLMFPFFAQQDPGVTQNYAVFMVKEKGQPFSTPGQMPENVRLPQGSSGTLKGETITYNKPEISTGLQIKRAPEVPLMYLSYIIIAIGAILCFFSQRQLWLSLRETEPGKTEILLYPKTNKARLSFQRELLAIQTALNSIVSPPKTVETASS
jgi:cytochrome c biogenesis protein